MNVLSYYTTSDFGYICYMEILMICDPGDAMTEGGGEGGSSDGLYLI